MIPNETLRPENRSAYKGQPKKLPFFKCGKELKERMDKW